MVQSNLRTVAVERSEYTAMLHRYVIFVAKRNRYAAKTDFLWHYYWLVGSESCFCNSISVLTCRLSSSIRLYVLGSKAFGGLRTSAWGLSLGHVPHFGPVFCLAWFSACSGLKTSPRCSWLIRHRKILRLITSVTVDQVHLGPLSFAFSGQALSDDNSPGMPTVCTWQLRFSEQANG